MTARSPLAGAAGGRAGGVDVAVAVVTITAGRDGHLQRQRVGLGRSLERPELHVVVGMGERPSVPPIDGGPRTEVLAVPSGRGGLPLARARNAGAARAMEAGAEVLVFLDVDCIPAQEMVGAYASAAAVAASAASVGSVAASSAAASVVGDRAGDVFCGPVAYLPPAGPAGYPPDGLDALASPHPGRPAPMPGIVERDDRWELFWSLSFCVTAATWRAVGGFDTAYVGYGAEDTDWALRARAAGASLLWVGSALAHHQHHRPARDDRRRAQELWANAQRFHAQHGWWPMRGWLEELTGRGWIDWDGGGEGGGPFGQGGKRVP